MGSTALNFSLNKLAAHLNTNRGSANILSAIAIPSSTPSEAWDGYDYESGSYLEIEDEILVREEEEIEYYDYGSSEYRYGDVERVEFYQDSTEVEIYDYEAGEYRTFEMD